jgi:hypothetical protein
MIGGGSMKKYLIPALLSLIVGVALWFVQRDVVSLVYEVVESASFPYDKGEGRFFVITVQNDGTKPLQNINLEIGLSSGSITTVRFSPDKLITDVKQEQQNVRGIIPLLNPKEKVATTVTAQGSGPISSPNVIARAVGVTATRKSDLSVYQVVSKILMPLTAGFTIVMIILLFNTKKSSDLETFVKEKDNIREEWQKAAEVRDQEHERRMTELKEQQEKYEKIQEEAAKGKPDREQLIFAIINRAGLSHLFPRLMELGEGIMYRNTGYLLLHEFLLDQRNSEKYINALEQIVSCEGMAPQSKGVNLYLLYKMAKFRGNDERAKYFLKQCEAETPLMYDHLMAHDDYYDLVSLKEALLDQQQQKKG